MYNDEYYTQQYSEEALQQRVTELEQFLKDFELFEAEIIEDDECWKEGSPYILGFARKHFDKWLKLQDKRNQLLGR